MCRPVSLHELRRVPRLIDGNSHDARVAPMQMRHALRGIEAVRAGRVEIENENLASG